ncbi:MAG: AAA family ATPase [Nitrosomonas sp.]|nr:AAA family ATPase [Nitrosomonas sp.]
MEIDIRQQSILIDSLMHPDVFNHPSGTITCIETHISWVILAGDYAYKIKKACNLGFLDFSTLKKRRHFCNEEVRLNRRLAAPLYIGVIPLTGEPEQPGLRGSGTIIEYAIKMIRFPQQAQLDHMLIHGKLETRHIDAYAQMIADFHCAAASASEETDFGDPAHVDHAVTQVFSQLRCQPEATRYTALINDLEDWCASTFKTLTPLFEYRKHSGFIRECHGDMHLRNLVWFDEHPLAFDCLEFDPDLRWIDVLSEVAFLVMDLDYRRQHRLAYRFLNAYLERTGDYAGMPVLRFYLVYRALVRAMVDAIRAAQPGISPAEHKEAAQAFCSYLELAQSYCRPAIPSLMITHGLSGSGKSTLSQLLLEQTGALRIRSDVERKRIFGLLGGLNMANTALNTDAGAYHPDSAQQLYSRTANTRTYATLKQLAEKVLEGRFPVIIDAVFLHHEERTEFRALALRMQAPFIILAFTASANTLRQRIRERKNDVSDADLAVLEMQLGALKPLQDAELPHHIVIDTEQPFDAAQLASAIERISTGFTAD